MREKRPRDAVSFSLEGSEWTWDVSLHIRENVFPERGHDYTIIN